MSHPPRRFFSGESESQAVLEAAGHFGLLPAELAYRPVGKKHGLLRRPRVVIEVDPEQPRREEGTAGPAGDSAVRAAGTVGGAPADPGRGSEPGRTPARGATLLGVPWETLDPPPAAPGVSGAPSAAAAVAALAGLQIEATAEERNGVDGPELRLDLRGPDRPALLARQGALLSAVEYVLRRMIREQPQGGLAVDSDGFRASREEDLRRRATSAAAEVRRTGQPFRFEPLPASDRRILHLAIQGEAGLTSESEGEGELRLVLVFARPEPGVD